MAGARGSRRYFGVFPELLLLGSVSRPKLLGFQASLAWGHWYGVCIPSEGRALLHEPSNSEGEKLRKSRAITW